MSINKYELCNELIAKIEEYKPKYKKVSWNEEELDMRTVSRTLDVCINLIKNYRDYRQQHLRKANKFNANGTRTLSEKLEKDSATNKRKRRLEVSKVR